MQCLKSLVLVAGATLAGLTAPARIQLTDIAHA